MKLYAGNLAYDVTDDDLRQAFAAFGKVESASIVKDKFTNQSKGFGFVEMPAKAEAQTAIDQLTGKELKGRPINVSEARPRPDGGKGGSWGARRSGGGRSW